MNLLEEFLSVLREDNMKLDKKFVGEIRKVKDNSIVPPDQYIVFLVKDTAFANVLPQYLAECARLGCDSAQMKAVVHLIRDVQTWRQACPLLCKTPDALGEKLLP